MTQGLSNTRLLAFVSDGESAASIRALMHRQNIANFMVEPGTVVEATAYLKAHPSPEILLVEIPSAEAAPRLLDELADTVDPKTKVVVCGPVDTFRFYHWLMGLGIQDYLLTPFNEQQLASALVRGQQAAVKNDDAPTTKKLVAVIGARGGVGTTTIATALASIFAQEKKLPTALVDLDAHFGTVALSLDLEPSRGLRDALEKPDRVDTLFLERVMIRPQPNLSILSAEESFAELITTQPNSGDLLLAALREKFPMVVVDVPRRISTLTRSFLSHADVVLLVVEPGILSLRDALRIKDYLVETLKRPAPIVVVNHQGLHAKQELPKGDFAKHYGGKPELSLPHVEAVMATTARGDLLIEEAKCQAVVEPLRQLATQLVGVESKAKDKPAAKSGLGFLKGKK